jgi:hypothetical protein
MMQNGRYRSIFSSAEPAQIAFPAARDEMRAWLRSKDYDVDAFDRDDSRIAPGVVLLHRSANAADGTRSERWQLREHQSDGAWVFSLTVHAPGSAAPPEQTWFWIEAGFELKAGQAATESHTAGPPRVVRGLLGVVPAQDSLAALTETPLIVRQDGVDELIDIICDPDRRLPMLVASAHPAIQFEEWRPVIERATRPLPGLASIYMLDPLATQQLSVAVPSSHGVWGGAIRTYLPGVDPAVADEAARHRVLGASQLAANPSRAAHILSALPRRLALEAPVPAPLAAVNRTLLTQVAGRAAEPDASELRKNVGQLEDDLNEAVKLGLEQEQRANSLFRERQATLAELTEREQQVLNLEHQVRNLRHQLRAAGHVQEFIAAVEPVPLPPGTFAELLDWVVNELPHVEYTGGLGPPFELDESPEAPTWVRSSWEVLRALESYAEYQAAPGFDGDFKIWCERCPPEGYAVSPGKVVRDESDTVRNKPRWARERKFPVPLSIDPSGSLFMGAHVRIGAGGQIAPRLYFLDATNSEKKIYVGYLGRHLTNTRS